MEAITLNVIISSITGIVLFALGFLVNVLTGKSRAELRGIISQARKNEAESDSDYAQLARDAAKDLRTLREEYEKDKKQKDGQIEKLSDRIDVLEKEKAEWLIERKELIRKISMLEAKVQA
jgi:hypothetical protein